MIDMYANYRVLLWKRLKTAIFCPVYDESSRVVGKKVPRKVFQYFPLKDWLKRLYASRHTSLKIQWNEKERVTDEDILQHHADGKA